jgi:hypothetical protein
MIPRHLIASLGSAANSAINGVLRTGAVSAGQATPNGEVGFVAAVVLGGVPAITKAWWPILRPAGYSVSMTGVFCHQTPRASFIDAAGKPRQCELADLLVVAEDLTSGTPARRWAVLIQAKMATPGVGQSLSSQGDLIQLGLLSHWPPFTLPPGFAPGARNFTICPHAGKALDCGQYGLVDPQPFPLWHQQAPAQAMPYGGKELGTFLAGMIESGQVGYGREATGFADDWSRTVDELMKVTAGLGFTYAAGLKGRHPRGNTSVAFSISSGDERYPSGQWHREPPPSGGRHDQAEDAPSEGINLLRIGIARIEQDDRRR